MSLHLLTYHRLHYLPPGAHTLLPPLPHRVTFRNLVLPTWAFIPTLGSVSWVVVVNHLLWCTAKFYCCGNFTPKSLMPIYIACVFHLSQTVEGRIWTCMDTVVFHYSQYQFSAHIPTACMNSVFCTLYCSGGCDLAHFFIYLPTYTLLFGIRHTQFDFLPVSWWCFRCLLCVFSFSWNQALQPSPCYINNILPAVLYCNWQRRSTVPYGMLYRSIWTPERLRLPTAPLLICSTSTTTHQTNFYWPFLSIVHSFSFVMDTTTIRLLFHHSTSFDNYYFSFLPVILFLFPVPADRLFAVFLHSAPF